MDKIQERAIYLALRGHNILITGFPGTGKSFTVIELAKQLKAVGKNVVVTATTGIAAQGLSKKLPEHYGTVSTIHKFVGLKDGRYENDELLNLIVNDENFVDIKDNINSMDTLIIDEISMLSRKFLVQIQYIFESVRCSACPGGGGVKSMFLPPPHFFVEEIYISGQIKQKTLFLFHSKIFQKFAPPPPFKRNKKVCPHFVVCSYATASVT